MEMEMQFTIEELETIASALNSQYIQAKMRDIKAGRSDSKTTQKLNKVCSHAYLLLVQALDKECENNPALN